MSLAFQIMRWLLTPLAAIDGIVVGTIFGAGAGALLRALTSDLAVDSFLPLDARTACIAAAAAFSAVTFGSVMAPAGRRITSMVIFIIGSCAAWYLIGMWSFPEGHARGYEASMLPFAGIELGGLTGIAFVFWRTQRKQPLETETL